MYQYRESKLCISTTSSSSPSWTSMGYPESALWETRVRTIATRVVERMILVGVSLSWERTRG